MSDKNIALDRDGNKFECKPSMVFTDCLFINDKLLVSLEVNQKLEDVFCRNNTLEKIIMNKKLNRLVCHDNNLTELNLPKGLKALYCENNQLKSLKLPKGLAHLRCDPELFDYATCEIENVGIVYQDGWPTAL